MQSLEHLSMLDLTHMLSGPYGTMLLADLGVQTIKVEPIGRGEGTRRLLADDPDNSVDGMGAYFMTLNRNKKSVALDLKKDSGRSVFYDLVRQVDIVFDNFSPGVTERLGIDYPTLSEHNPRIITCSVSGFGGTGPGRSRPAFDLVAQGMGGAMSITGTPESGPVRSGIPIGDLGGGLFGALGVLAAVAAREKSGRGQHVDISMLDAQISLLNYMATMHFLSGKNPRPEGNAHFVHVPYNVYRTKTQHLIIAVITDNFWNSLVEILGDDALRDPQFDKQPGRFEARDFINGRIAFTLRTKSCNEWLELFNAARIPCAPVNRLGDALQDRQVQSRGMIAEVELPGGQTVRMPANPIKLSGFGETRYTSPPLIGAQTDEVLASVLGYGSEKIAQLRNLNVVE